MNRFPGYVESLEKAMRAYFHSLDEDHRRRYGAIEALKIGYGGISYISRLLGISRQTIYVGIHELEVMSEGDPEQAARPSGSPERIRREGGGCPPATQRQEGLEEAVEEILEAHGAGSPTDENVRWTDLKPRQLAQDLVGRGYEAGRNLAAKLMDRAGYRRRSLRKELICGAVDPQERDRQFRNIQALREHARAHGIPVLCVDTKKKERLGTLHRRGQVYSTGNQRVFDHDYRYLSTGPLIPHGVYDYFEHSGFVTLGTSRETSAFVCDAIALAWEEVFRARYPHAPEVFLTFDAGGANAVRSVRFKEDLVALSQRMGVRLRIAHYPPYTSKWHPIEHRLFSQIERGFQGIILDSPQTALDAVQRTRTETGLTVTARVLDTVYELGRKCSATFKYIKHKFICHDDTRGKWNYVVDAKGIS
jgi:hypothetical protein